MRQQTGEQHPHSSKYSQTIAAEIIISAARLHIGLVGWVGSWQPLVPQLLSDGHHLSHIGSIEPPRGGESAVGSGLVSVCSPAIRVFARLGRMLFEWSDSDWGSINSGGGSWCCMQCWHHAAGPLLPPSRPGPNSKVWKTPLLPLARSVLSSTPPSTALCRTLQASVIPNSWQQNWHCKEAAKTAELEIFCRCFSLQWMEDRQLRQFFSSPILSLQWLSHLPADALSLKSFNLVTCVLSYCDLSILFILCCCFIDKEKLSSWNKKKILTHFHHHDIYFWSEATIKSSQLKLLHIFFPSFTFPAVLEMNEGWRRFLLSWNRFSKTD